MNMTQSNLSSFGTVLTAFRRRRGITQQRLAEQLGVRRNTIGTWERGDFLPGSKGIVLELARHLHLDEQETRQLLEASLTTLTPPFLVPLPRNPFFTGREAVMKALHAALETTQPVALTQSYALHGLGGIGKTQIALEYAYQHALEYCAVFWIEAETEETANSSLLRIAELLQLPERLEPDQQRMVAAIQRWLGSHSGWLLIWDNLDNLDLLSHLLPAARQGAILLTTRCQALGTLARGMDVVPMEPEEGMMFVLRRTRALFPEATGTQMQQFAALWPGEYAAARELVTIMGGLPLALDQVGAYIEETGCSFADYLQRYQQQRWHLLARRGEMLSDHPHSVVATLALTCQRVEQQHPSALELLRLCACLYPDALPEELLLAGTSSVEPVLADLALFDAALATLRRFSLVQRQPETRTLSLHRLIQVILQEEMGEQEYATWQQRAVHLLNAIFPDITPVTQVEAWRQCERLLPHVMSCLATIPDHRQNQEMAALLLKTASYLHERSQDKQAESLFQRALLLFERQVGQKDPLMGTALARLASLYRVRGKYTLAEPLLQRALRLQEQTLGTEHPKVAFSLNSLAAVYRALSRYEQAESLYLRAIQIFEQALGPEQPEVAGPVNNLGLLYCDMGNYEQAELLFQRAVQVFEQALGSEHPQVALSLSNLGLFYRQLGRYEQAEPLFQRSIQIFEQVLDPEYPEIARPLNNLGDLYREQGHYEQAELFCRRALRIWERILGSEHPDVAASLDTLASLYSDMGNYEQAEPLYQRAVDILERVLDPMHPQIAFPLSGLAHLRHVRGKDEEAARLYQRVLQIREQHRGPHHPETAQTLFDLALVRQQQGKLNEAVSLAERALAIQTQTLGDASAKTSATQTLLIQIFQEQASPMPSPETEQPTMCIVVRGETEQIAYTRTVKMRAVTFTCTTCRQTVTQQRYPSGQIKYCSEACKTVSAAQRQELRVARQREKRRNERDASLRPQNML